MQINLALECKLFVEKNQKRYLELLKEVLDLIAYVQRIDDSDCIYRYYSRKDNKNEDSEFKRPYRIAEKLSKWRKLHSIRSNINDIHDIIGVTVVVYYHSDIQHLYELIEQHCDKKGLQIFPYLNDGNFRDYKKFGYHARHLVLTSHQALLVGLKCEVQIKTLLHDAWGVKTHSITYKPPGELSEEHRMLMESFGESIQAFEIQSEMVRSIITYDWNEEDNLRYAARLETFKKLEGQGFGNGDLEIAYKEIFHHIQSEHEQIKSCPLDSPIIADLLKSIFKLREREGGLSAAWLLMMYLASCRRDNNLNHLAKSYVDEWVQVIPDPALGVLYVATCYYVIGERSEAIAKIASFFLGRPYETEPEKKLKHNLLYYLIEEAMYSSHRADEIKVECDHIIKELRYDTLDSFEENHLKYAAKDNWGYYKIVFGQTKKEIEEGILLCQNAYPPGAPIEVGTGFGLIHQRTGWRRYLRART